jgi:hypothetical protein
MDDIKSEYALSNAKPRPKTNEIRIGHINPPPSIKY